MKYENDLKHHMAHNCKDSNEENDDNTDSESENEEEDLECDECGEVSENFDAYIEHRGKGDCVFWCNNCDKFFRQEEDLKKHTDTCRHPAVPSNDGRVLLVSYISIDDF